MGAVLFDHGRLTREHEEEDEFLFVPVSPRRSRPRLQRLAEIAELGQPTRVGIAQPLEGAVLLRSSLGPPLCR